MRIIQELKAGEDFPATIRPNARFAEEIGKETRKRLGLRPQDIVEVVFL
mgnify:CR=1 FL=1